MDYDENWRIASICFSLPCHLTQSLLFLLARIALSIPPLARPRPLGASGYGNWAHVNDGVRAWPIRATSGLALSLFMRGWTVGEQRNSGWTVGKQVDELSDGSGDKLRALSPPARSGSWRVGRFAHCCTCPKAAMSDHLVDVVGELESTEQHVWMGQPVQGCIEEILRRKK